MRSAFTDGLLRKFFLTALLAIGLVLAYQSTANATLQLRQPAYQGKVFYSADGLGQNGTGGTVQSDVPAGSTVIQAFLYGTYFFTEDPDLASRTIDFDGTNVVLDTISSVNSLSTARADVTGLVKAKVGDPVAPGGITDFAINNDPALLDGVGLVVVYSNPILPDGTVAVLDGSASQGGDSATFTFAAPLDKTIAGFAAQMSLGSGFSFQGVSGSACGGGQFSIVNVNSQLLTNCAGNFDDGLGNNGALITVGGVGDSIDNPTPPDNPATDDELYNIEPFTSQGDTQLVITSSNPSQDDNLFLSVIAITAKAAVTTEDCDNGIDDDGDGLVDGADPDCQITGGECSDGIDNDGDHKIDFGPNPNHNDPDCDSPSDRERPECSDHVDNDGDGKTDWSRNRFHRDPQCSSPKDDDESNGTHSASASASGTPGLP
jgi:hypothetical protein